jgi:hypothetical protein
MSLGKAPGKWAYLFWATFYGFLHLSLSLYLSGSQLEFGSAEYNWLTGAIILGPLAFWIDLYYRFMAKAALLRGVVISVRQVLGFWVAFAMLASMVFVWPDEFADNRRFALILPMAMVVPMAQGLWFYWKYFRKETLND